MQPRFPYSRTLALVLSGFTLTAGHAQIIRFPPMPLPVDQRDTDQLQRAVAEDPSAVEHQLALSEAYVAGGRTEAAQRLLESAFKRHADNLAVRCALARVCLTGGQFERVVELLGPLEQQLEPELLMVLATSADRLPSGTKESHAILRRGAKRFPNSLPLRLAEIDSALKRERYAGALRGIEDVEQRFGPRAELHNRAARAYFELGQLLGDVQVRAVARGREGQFSGPWLLIEARGEEGVFLCCPRRSAMYQLRRALDAGLDTAAAHLMHARIWQRIGKPHVALAIVKGREALLLEDPHSDVLEVLARLALDADALRDFARYARMQARIDPDHSRSVIKNVYLRLAERYNERGDGKMYAKCLERAARLDPGDVDIAMRQADATWSAGRRETAARYYRQVLELDPDHAQRRRIIERLGQWQSEKPDPG